MTDRLNELDEVAAVQKAIDDFIMERLEAKLEPIRKDLAKKLKALPPEDFAGRNTLELEAQEKEAEQRSKFGRAAWLEDAARRSEQLSLVTHALKFIHPDARGSSIFMQPYPGSGGDVVATNPDCKEDVVGNAAALDVYKFLSIEAAGRTLLDRVFSNDPVLFAALGGNDAARSCLEKFREMRKTNLFPSSHTLTRQVYWPLATGGYHLLAPLFPSSLVQQAYEQMQNDRFGESAKIAHTARKEGKGCEHGFRDYPNLLIQRYGGSNKQNISYLNSKRHGENWLLCSCPPAWQASRLRLPLYAESVFGYTLSGQLQIREQISGLIAFLEKTGDYTNKKIRETRAAFVSSIIDDIIQWAARLGEKKGWSRDPHCRLHQAERCWLDPAWAEEDKPSEWEDVAWKEIVARRFANWFNRQLTTKSLPMADNEYEEWKKEFLEAL